MNTETTLSKPVSFEFFPPRTEKGVEALHKTREELIPLDPQYFSVTFGAGGSTQDPTINTVLDIQQNTSIDAASHLTCIGTSKEYIVSLLDNFKDNDIRHIVALRGDMPSGQLEAGDLRYASELVRLIREHSGDHFCIKIAAYPEFHPQCKSAATDLQHYKEKVDAGANNAITQYFYNRDAYFSFVDSCEKIGADIPVFPGIMPITNFTQLARFSDSCGTEIPRWIRSRLESYGDDLESIRAFGLDVVTHLCEQLLDGGAPGLHFYTMNRAEPTLSIINNLNLKCE